MLLFQVDPLTCQPVYPYQFLKVNTMFEVAREANMRTAWCDKHPAYDILNGPSGMGIQDLFTPEINSDAPTLGSPGDWASNNTLTQQYDSFKVSWGRKQGNRLSYCLHSTFLPSPLE